MQRYTQNRRSQLQQHPDFHITSSTILASTLHITRLNTRNPTPPNLEVPSMPGLRPGPNPPTHNRTREQSENGDSNNRDRLDSSMENPGEPDLGQAEPGPGHGPRPGPGNMNSFSSLLFWILGGASSEGLNSFLSMFRDVREQGQVYAESPRDENGGAENVH